MRPPCGGVHVRSPISCAVRPPSAVAFARLVEPSVPLLGWSWQAAAGVVAALVTVTVTDPPAAIVPRLQLSKLATMVQLPCDVLMLDQTRPPLPGNWSVSVTLVAELLPAGAGLLTTIV